MFSNQIFFSVRPTFHALESDKAVVVPLSELKSLKTISWLFRHHRGASTASSSPRRPFFRHGRLPHRPPSRAEAPDDDGRDLRRRRLGRTGRISPAPRQQRQRRLQGAANDAQVQSEIPQARLGHGRIRQSQTLVKNDALFSRWFRLAASQWQQTHQRPAEKQKPPP